MTDAERREYFRISDRLPLEYRSVGHEEAALLAERIKYGATYSVDRAHEMYFFRENMLREEEEKDELHKYLRNIERKLDFVIDQFHKVQKNQCFITRFAEVCLSGAGIKFVSDVVLDDMLPVEMRLILPVFPYPNITALCSTVWSKLGEAEGSPNQELALNFDWINEADRDLLINYIFMKERERLRQSKDTKAPKG